MALRAKNGGPAAPPYGSNEDLVLDQSLDILGALTVATGLTLSAGTFTVPTISATTIGATTITATRFDAPGCPASYATPNFSMGVYGGTPIADTSLLDNVFMSICVSSGVNKTGADSSVLPLIISNRTTAHVANNKMQTILSSMNVGHNVFDAYAGQFTLSITGTMATAAGNANLVALASKVSIKDTFTATGSVSGHYIVVGDTGATTGACATGTFDAIRIETNATNLNSFLNCRGGPNSATYFAVLPATGCVSASATALSGVTSSHKLAVDVAGVGICYIPIVTSGMS